jgi:hypothetical protein
MNNTSFNLVGNGVNLNAVTFSSNKKYTFYEPNWAVSDKILRTLEQRFPNFDVETLFLVAPFKDIISGAVQDYSYWEDKGYLKYDSSNDKQYGFIPSYFDENSLSMSSIKIFDSAFVAPKFLPVFFMVNNIKGKTRVTWTLYDDTDPEIRTKVIRVRGVSYFIYRFDSVGIYSLEVEVEDNSGSKHSGQTKNIISIVEKDEYIDFIESRLNTRKINLLNK